MITCRSLAVLLFSAIMSFGVSALAEDDGKDDRDDAPVLPASPLAVPSSGPSLPKPDVDSAMLSIAKLRNSNAQVFIDDVLIGEAPGNFYLPAGTYQVELRIEHHKPRILTLRLRAGQVRKIAGLNFEPIVVKMRLTSNVDGAVIYIDGQHYGWTSQKRDVVIRVPVYARELVARYKDTPEFRRSLQLEPGSDQTLAIDFKNRPEKKVEKAQPRFDEYTVKAGGLYAFLPDDDDRRLSAGLGFLVEGYFVPRNWLGGGAEVAIGAGLGSYPGLWFDIHLGVGLALRLGPIVLGANAGGGLEGRGLLSGILGPYGEAASHYLPFRPYALYGPNLHAVFGPVRLRVTAIRAERIDGIHYHRLSGHVSWHGKERVITLGAAYSLLPEARIIGLTLGTTH